MRRPLLLLLVPLALVAAPAFAQDVAYESDRRAGGSGEGTAGGMAVDVEYGAPNTALDAVGWVLGAPNKLLLWDSRVDNHAVSTKTVDEAAEFLADNGVDGVLIRVNQYDPLGEWRRLAENDRVGLGWRLTVGSLYTLGYSIAPGRLLGGDWYNPYTDTVHVYSDVPALAMEQAAQAKDVHERSHPGFYSAVRLLPLVGLVHEARSKEAVFAHVDQTGAPAERAEARRVLLPQMGAEVGGQALYFLPQLNALAQLGGAAVGHVFGRTEAAKVGGPVQGPAPAPACGAAIDPCDAERGTALLSYP